MWVLLEYPGGSYLNAQRWSLAQDWDHAGSGGRYMAHKVAKLQQQYRETASNSEARTGIDGELFKGVSIFVNGLTNPSQAVSAFDARERASAFLQGNDFIERVVALACCTGIKTDHGFAWRAI